MKAGGRHVSPPTGAGPRVKRLAARAALAQPLLQFHHFPTAKLPVSARPMSQQDHYQGQGSLTRLLGCMCYGKSGRSARGTSPQGFGVYRHTGCDTRLRFSIVLGSATIVEGFLCQPVGICWTRLQEAMGADATHPRCILHCCLPCVAQRHYLG